MTSEYEKFWQCSSFAVVGNSAKAPFAKLTYAGLKQLGKQVYAVDPSAASVSGDPAYRDFSALPFAVEAAVLELPETETAAWVAQAAATGIKKLWIHMGTETSEALEIAHKAGIQVLTGTCAVVYLTPDAFPHNVHRYFRKLSGKY